MRTDPPSPVPDAKALFRLAHAFADEVCARETRRRGQPVQIDADRLMAAFTRAYGELIDRDRGII